MISITVRNDFEAFPSYSVCFVNSLHENTSVRCQTLPQQTSQRILKAKTWNSEGKEELKMLLPLLSGFGQKEINLKAQDNTCRKVAAWNLYFFIIKILQQIYDEQVPEPVFQCFFIFLSLFKICELLSPLFFFPLASLQLSSILHTVPGDLVFHIIASASSLRKLRCKCDHFR